MKKLLTAVILAMVLLIVVGFAKDILIKTSVEKGVEFVTGLKLTMKSLNVGILTSRVGIKDLKLHNPYTFKDKVMLDMPEIYAAFDLPAIFGGTIHLKEIRMDMNEFTVVKDASGKLNLDSLKVVQAEKADKEPSKKSGGKAPQVKIDLLKLKIGKVIYKDYSAGASPKINEFNLGLNEEYRDIDNPYSLVSLIVVKALMNTSIAGLANFDLAGLKKTVGPELATAQKLVGESVVKATAALKTVQAQTSQLKATLTQPGQTTEATVKQTEEAVKKTADALKDVFKNPFGGASDNK